MEMYVYRFGRRREVPCPYCWEDGTCAENCGVSLAQAYRTYESQRDDASAVMEHDADDDTDAVRRLIGRGRQPAADE